MRALPGPLPVPSGLTRSIELFKSEFKVNLMLLKSKKCHVLANKGEEIEISLG